jgi:hypothetical protein
MTRKSRREAIKARRRRRQKKTTLLWGAVGIAGLGVVGFLIWNVARPAAGQAVPIQPTGHIAEGTVPEAGYNTEPPTSGPHYPSPLKPGFYDEVMASNVQPSADGYLVHNLEHGYVILWYDCQGVTQPGDCSALKDQVRQVIDRFDSAKLIGFPREGLDLPLVLTSWGRVQRFEKFDLPAVSAFIERNRNRGPESTPG